MRLTLAVLLLAAADSKYVERDLDKVAAEYLIVAPPAFADSLDALADHRSKAHKVAIVRTDDIAARLGKGAEGIAKLAAKVKPRFLLLAGDADAVPTFVRKSAYVSDRFPTDADLATDHFFGPVAGRFPADTADELKAMIGKTIEYETTLAGGRWQKRISFVTGQGGFGALIDEILERQFAAVVTDRIPPAYDVETAYAKPSSKYCFYPPKFHANAVRMLNDGALFYAYVGHGMRDSFDDLVYNEKYYPIFESKNVKEVDVREGFPIMVVIACSTGEFDWNSGDAIGEQLFKRPRGPVAFIGGSRTTQPYGNALLGHKLVDQIFHQKAPTIGEALWAAKEATLGKDDSALRLQADAIAALVQGPANLEPMRKDVVLHYNLFGDPALKIRRPEGEIEIAPRGQPGAGRTFVVTGRAKESPVEITFECARDRFHHPIDLEGEDVEKQITRRYANANNKVIAKSQAAAKGGEFEAELELPKDLKPGKYHLKASAPGALGSVTVEIPEVR